MIQARCLTWAFCPVPGYDGPGWFRVYAGMSHPVGSVNQPSVPVLEQYVLLISAISMFRSVVVALPGRVQDSSCYLHTWGWPLLPTSVLHVSTMSHHLAFCELCENGSEAVAIRDDARAHQRQHGFAEPGRCLSMVLNAHQYPRAAGILILPTLRPKTVR